MAGQIPAFAAHQFIMGQDLPPPPSQAATRDARQLEATMSHVYRTIGKRAFDIVCSGLLLLVLIPLLTAIAIAIKLESPGPVFFRARRVGYRGRPMLMLKFRKMHDDAVGGPLTVDGDSRLTRVGRVLTRTRFDELPQFWDVLRGRMSIIGPRPEDPGFVALHDEEYSLILQVRPGITGLSQIAYKEEQTIVNTDRPVEDYINRILPQKLTMDKLYAQSTSFRLDLQVVLWTLVTVILRHPVSVNRATGAMSIRHRRPTDVPAPLPVAKGGMLGGRPQLPAPLDAREAEPQPASLSRGDGSGAGRVAAAPSRD